MPFILAFSEFVSTSKEQKQNQRLPPLNTRERQSVVYRNYMFAAVTTGDQTAIKQVKIIVFIFRYGIQRRLSKHEGKAMPSVFRFRCILRLQLILNTFFCIQ